MSICTQPFNIPFESKVLIYEKAYALYYSKDSLVKSLQDISIYSRNNLKHFNQFPNLPIRKLNATHPSALEVRTHRISINSCMQSNVYCLIIFVSVIFQMKTAENSFYNFNSNFLVKFALSRIFFPHLSTFTSDLTS